VGLEEHLTADERRAVIADCDLNVLFDSRARTATFKVPGPWGQRARRRGDFTVADTYTLVTPEPTPGAVGTSQPRRRTQSMSIAEEPEESATRVYDPDEAMVRASPLPTKEVLVLRGVPDEEWKAFQSVPAEE
jgi:hypothetical protein